MDDNILNESAGEVMSRPDLGADYTLCECELESLKEFVISLEAMHRVDIRKSPSICLTMIPAEDSLEKQKFYLGEALTMECEVSVDGYLGYGLCLGNEPVRAYCIAVMDALLHAGQSHSSGIEIFLRKHAELVAQKDKEEFDLILQTQVDFKLMEEA